MYTRKYEGNLSFEEKIFFVPLEQDLCSLLCRLPQPVPPVQLYLLRIHEACTDGCDVVVGEYRQGVACRVAIYRHDEDIVV